MTARTITGHFQTVAVLGDPISHSLSPAMHNAGFAALDLPFVMVPHRVSAADLPQAIRGLVALGYRGASVTLPHKEAVYGLCDQLDESAKQSQVVNCIDIVGGKVIGHNTDQWGFVHSLTSEMTRLGLQFSPNRMVLVLGGGGAARAVVSGLLTAGATVKCILRNPAAAALPYGASIHPWTAQTFEQLCPQTQIIVDCTSAGVSDTDVPFPADIPWSLLPTPALAFSLIYHRNTAFLKNAQKHGIATVDGRDMLLFQGVRAFELWTGKTAPVEHMRRALIT